MKRELGIARCGLACCLCSENISCSGCDTGNCPDREWCENLRCSREKGLQGCWECTNDCQKGLLGKIKPSGFRAFVQRYGMTTLLDCLERNEQCGIVYHREGINGDYDNFEEIEALIDFIRFGRR